MGSSMKVATLFLFLSAVVLGFIALRAPEPQAAPPQLVRSGRVPYALSGPVPDGWPRVRPNSQGLQYFVYHRTRDFMRRVSKTVSIGAAYKVERPLDHYFLLSRRDP